MTRTTFRIALVVAIAAAGAVIPVACSDDSATTASTGTNTGSLTGTGTSTAQGGATAGTATGGTGTATGGGATAAGGNVIGGPAECQGHIYQCGDTIDNDMDGKIDSFDSDCLGPCDDTEDSYYGGIPGQNNAGCKQDCYFDQDTGTGNDDCYWSHECDPNSVPPNYYPEPVKQCDCQPITQPPGCADANIPGTSKRCSELYNTQSQLCLDYCGPLTPNGCDCFGCCELPAGSNQFVWLGSEGLTGTECTQAEINNPDVCHPCLPTVACYNDCDICELCVGKPTLPPECFDPDGGSSSSGGGGNSVPGQCPPGIQACGLPGQDPCPSGYYCITGCCQQLPQ